MRTETVDALLARIHSIETEVEVLQSTVDAERITESDRQYLARCFDLLHMELTAVRNYIAELG